MDITRVELATGRRVSLSRIEIKTTYGDFLEGYPCATVNELGILGPARERSRPGPPVHVIEPERAYPDQPPGPMGPVEVLPAFMCRGLFRSAPIDSSLDDYMDWSWLTVIWFEPALDAPLAEITAAAVAGLDWDSLAEDASC